MIRKYNDRFFRLIVSTTIWIMVIGVFSIFPALAEYDEDMDPLLSEYKTNLEELSLLNDHCLDQSESEKIAIERNEKLSNNLHVLESSSQEYINFYETEPNNNLDQANLVNSNYYGQNFYRIYGSITNFYYDLDYFRFDVTKSGTFNILGIWVGNYAGYGWEDDLGIGLFNANGDIISAAMLMGSGTNTYRYLTTHVTPGTYYILVLQMSDFEFLYVGEWYGLDVQFNADPSAVSTPTTPSGPDEGTVNMSYDYMTGGAVCSNGHSVEYRFDWGDGTYSNWSSSTTTTKTWAAPDIYQVKAQARCAYDNSITSSWSASKLVTITSEIQPGSDATLSDLTFSKGNLEPPFDPAETNYSVVVDQDVDLFNVTATLSDENASMTIDGEPIDSGVSKNFTFPETETSLDIIIVVTAEDDINEQTYNINVNRISETGVEEVILEKEAGVSYVEVDLTSWAIAFFNGPGDPIYDYVDGGPIVGIRSGARYIDLFSYSEMYFDYGGDFARALAEADQLAQEIIDKIELYKPSAEDLGAIFDPIVPGTWNIIIPFGNAETVLGATKADKLELLQDGVVVAEMEYREREEAPQESFVAFAVQPYTLEEVKAFRVRIK